MNRALILILFSIISFNCFSQGSWNIDYIEVNSIDKSHIGKSLKVDFKHLWKEDFQSLPKSIRSFIIPQDTGSITFNGKRLNVIEVRKVYVDHGSFDDQYLELLSNSKNIVTRIYNSKLLEISSEKLKLIISLETFELKRGKIRRKIKTENQEVWIDRKHLDGFMIKL